MPRAKKLHYHSSVLITREQRQAIQEYAKRHGLRWGEAVRGLVDLGLSHESDIEQAYSQGYADGAGKRVDQRSLSGMRGASAEEPGDLLLARLVKRPYWP